MPPFRNGGILAAERLPRQRAVALEAVFWLAAIAFGVVKISCLGTNAWLFQKTQPQDLDLFLGGEVPPFAFAHTTVPFLIGISA